MVENMSTNRTRRHKQSDFRVRDRRYDFQQWDEGKRVPNLISIDLNLFLQTIDPRTGKEVRRSKDLDLTQKIYYSKPTQLYLEYRGLTSNESNIGRGVIAAGRIRNANPNDLYNETQKAVCLNFFEDDAISSIRIKHEQDSSVLVPGSQLFVYAVYFEGHFQLVVEDNYSTNGTGILFERPKSDSDFESLKNGFLSELEANLMRGLDEALFEQWQGVEGIKSYYEQMLEDQYALGNEYLQVLLISRCPIADLRSGGYEKAILGFGSRFDENDEYSLRRSRMVIEKGHPTILKKILGKLG